MQQITVGATRFGGFSTFGGEFALAYKWLRLFAEPAPKSGGVDHEAEFGD